MFDFFEEMFDDAVTDFFLFEETTREDEKDDVFDENFDENESWQIK